MEQATLELIEEIRKISKELTEYKGIINKVKKEKDIEKVNKL